MTDTAQQATVQLLNKEGVANLLDKLQGVEENLQTAFDLTLIGLMLMRVYGVDPQEILEAIEKQIPAAELVADLFQDAPFVN